jgi:hypothetical protein
MICKACHYESAIYRTHNGRRVCIICGTPEGDERAEQLHSLASEGQEEAQADLFREFPKKEILC